MSELLRILEANEPTISAAVGILTLAAMLWGITQFALLPLLTALRERSSTDADATGEPGRFRLWASLINRGVNPGDGLVEQVSSRTFNACALLIVAATLGWLMATLVSGDVLVLSVLNFGAFILAVTAYNLQAVGFGNGARWLLIADIVLFWAFNIVVMGAHVGLEYFLGGILLTPLLLFGREKRYQLIVASLLVLLAFPAALWLEAAVDYSLPPAYLQIVPNYYYVNAMFLALLVTLILYSYNRSADESFRQLEDQKEKTEELIYSVLPAYIADKVTEQDSVVADWHSEASVLFATIHGFESLYQRVSAVQLIEILSEVFREFDELVETHGVEKINTLGTNYVAATGIDPTRAARHAGLARLALEMGEIVDRLSDTVSHQFTISVGLSTGDVVSGVIGRARPSYDIWGKTVELAHGMREATAGRSLIVNEAAYWRLRSEFDFLRCEADSSRYRLIGEKAA